MNYNPDPPRRHVRPCQPDLADQTTARLQALNATLQQIAAASADPYLQSKAERTERKQLRADVYAEIARLVGPADRIELITAAFEGVERRQAQGRRTAEPAPKFDPPSPLPTDSGIDDMRMVGEDASL